MKTGHVKNIFGQNTTKVRQLADLISHEISMGRYGAGVGLPSINALSRSYRVSRDTVFKAFMELKSQNLIDSTPGKGYYVVNRQKKILLLLDEYSPFKDVLYNSIVSNLPMQYKVDLWFHQYDEHLFDKILHESIGRYNAYVVMNFDNERFSDYLYRIESSRLLLLDFGKFDKRDYSYICQDFDEAFYHALEALDGKLSRYRKIVLIYPKGIKHPHSTCDYLAKYCADHRLETETYTGQARDYEVSPREAYIAFRQTDVVEIVKNSRRQGLECGKDFGLIAYNETPAYEVIDKGITTLSIDHRRMGEETAQFILTGKAVQKYLPTEVHLRGSL